MAQSGSSPSGNLYLQDLLLLLCLAVAVAAGRRVEDVAAPRGPAPRDRAAHGEQVPGGDHPVERSQQAAAEPCSGRCQCLAQPSAGERSTHEGGPRGPRGRGQLPRPRAKDRVGPGPQRKRPALLESEQAPDDLLWDHRQPIEEAIESGGELGLAGGAKGGGVAAGALVGAGHERGSQKPRADHEGA